MKFVPSENYEDLRRQACALATLAASLEKRLEIEQAIVAELRYAISITDRDAVDAERSINERLTNELAELHATGMQAGWTECAKQNPKERGRYLAVHNYGGIPEVQITNYGTSRKWDNGRNRLLPPEYRISHWMPIPTPPSRGQKP